MARSTAETTSTELVGGVYLGGSRHSGGGGPIPLLDPSTGESFATVSAAGTGDVADAVDGAQAAAESWADAQPVDRGRVCLRVAERLRSRAESLAEILVRDAGLPLSLARRDVEVAARYFEYYAGVTDKPLGNSIPLGPGIVDFTVREPWGVCAIILPFNFPLQLAARDIAPAVAMGNSVVLKPPEQDPLAALELSAILSEGGVPDGVVSAVTGLGPEVGAALVRHPDVDHITFTGSVSAARQILAGAATDIKPVTVELGGKSPHVIFADADVARAVQAIVGTTFRSAGQACSAGTRVLVERALHGRFVRELVTATAALTTGRAADDPDVGPLISAKQRDAVLDAVEGAEAAGARIAIGGGPPPDVPAGGFFVAPTILDEVAADSGAAQEEIFGPVLSVLPFSGEDQAVELANGTEFGLVAGVWTRDIGRALRVSHRVRAGQVFVNGYGVGGGVELPFGGTKRSGYGRVKGLEGALEYTHVKNVSISSE